MGTTTRTALPPPRSNLVKDVTTGAAAIAASFTAVRACKLISVSNKFSVAPTTSENFTVTLNARAGAAYDVTLYSVDPSAGSVTSIVWTPDSPLWLEPGDQVDVAFVNTDTRTYGVQMTLEEVG